MIGVLGGMGPKATADFLMKLVDATPVNGDADHIAVVARVDFSMFAFRVGSFNQTRIHRVGVLIKRNHK